MEVGGGAVPHLEIAGRKGGYKGYGYPEHDDVSRFLQADAEAKLQAQGMRHTYAYGWEVGHRRQ